MLPESTVKPTTRGPVVISVKFGPCPLLDRCHRLINLDEPVSMKASKDCKKMMNFYEFLFAEQWTRREAGKMLNFPIAAHLEVWPDLHSHFTQSIESPIASFTAIAGRITSIAWYFTSSSATLPVRVRVLPFTSFSP